MKLPADMDAAAVQMADQFSLPANLVRAFIAVESSGRWHAQRFEPGWRYWFRGFALSPAEKRFQATSWGPMQVMGAVARELGYTGHSDGFELCGPAGIEYGCRKLAQLRKRDLASWGWDGVARSYNTGQPRPSKAGNAYLAKIKRAMKEVGA